MYGIKIKDKQELYGRKHFRLRSDIIDPTYLRTKLVSDIRNRIGITSISANYIQLYINDKFMGLYIITDSLSLPWIENVFDDKKSTTLYKCTFLLDFTPEFYDGCVNKNEDVTDHTEWINFLKAIESAKSASDLENIFEVDHFLYEMAIDYLLNAQDHTFHNYYFYKQTNGKWIYLSYDFDLDFGLCYNGNDYYMTYEEYFQYYNYKGRLYDLLISQDPSKFNEIIKDVVKKVINPNILYPHIDELKQYIKPYVILDKTLDSNGNYPGVLNYDPEHVYITYEQWDAYSEFTRNVKGYGLKYWILMKYRNICHKLSMECDPTYMDENYEYTVNKDLEYNEDYYFIGDNTYTTTYFEHSTIISSEIPTPSSIEVNSQQFITSTSTITLIESETEYNVDVDIPTPDVDDDENSFDEEDTTMSIETTTSSTINV